MGKFLTKEMVEQQSRNALKQWLPKWEKNAKTNGYIHARHNKRHEELMYVGIGKTLLICAMGPSFERDIELIKEHHDNVDVACVDKAFKYLMENNIKPNYVFVADAAVSYEDYCEEYIEQTEGVALIMNVTGNPEWSRNWKGPVYFYINKDSIESEKIFKDISGVTQVIPASSNVGNTAVVFSAQMFGYDQYLLTGYDFCWYDDSNYYAFHDNEKKRAYMKHIALVTPENKLAYTSSNLMFSAKWLAEFNNQIASISDVCIKCCSPGLLMSHHFKLENQLKMAEKKDLTDKQKGELIQAHKKSAIVPPDKLNEIGNILKDERIVPQEVIVNYVNREVAEYARNN